MKKVFITGITVIMLGCLFLSACENTSNIEDADLEAYRLEKRVEIQNYADMHGRTNYTTENWSIIYEHVISGTQAISEAESKAGIDTIISNAKTAIDVIQPEKFDGVNNGAYFITDNSYENYIRNCAERVGTDEYWVQDVLNGGDGGEWSYLVRPKSWFWCVIADNQITVSGVENNVYNISYDNEKYIGTSFTNTISFCVKDDILYICEADDTLEYAKDSSYTESVSELNILKAPENIETHIGGTGLNYLMLQWENQYYYGTIGVSIEVKKAGEQIYEEIKIEKVYMNLYTVQLDKTKFNEGENFVRLHFIGSPSITNTKSIIINKNSEYITFQVFISGDEIKIKII